MMNAVDAIYSFKTDANFRNIGNEKAAIGFYCSPDAATLIDDMSSTNFSLTYVISGNGRFKDKQNRVTKLQPGSLVLKHPGQPFSLRRSTTDYAEFFIIIPNSIYNAMIQCKMLHPDFWYHEIGVDLLLIQQMKKLVSSFKKANDQEMTMLLIDIQKFIVTLCSHESTMGEGEFNGMIRKAEKLLQSNLKEEISMPDVAKELGTEYDQFRKKFKEVKHESPMQYRLRKRFEYAQKLLFDQKVSVKDLAIIMGYPDTATFSRQFHKTTGITPRMFKRVYF